MLSARVQQLMEYDCLRITYPSLSMTPDYSSLQVAEPADLSGQDLREVRASGADLKQVVFQGANLTKADLSESDLSNCDMSNANLSGANLKGANLAGTNLNGANLREAILDAAKLSTTQLENASLDFASLQGALDGSYVILMIAIGGYLFDYLFMDDGQVRSLTLWTGRTRAGYAAPSSGPSNGTTWYSQGARLPALVYTYI